jgi:hypothetical protein
MCAARPGVAERFRVGGLALDDEGAGGPGSLTGSEFHQVVAGSDRLSRFLRDDPDFRAVRLLTSLLYLSLHNVGVPLAGRYLLCYAVGRGCEELFDIDTMAVLDRVAR